MHFSRDGSRGCSDHEVVVLALDVRRVALLLLGPTASPGAGSEPLRAVRAGHRERPLNLMQLHHHTLELIEVDHSVSIFVEFLY